MISSVIRELTQWFYSEIGRLIPKVLTASIIIMLGYLAAKIMEKLARRVLEGLEINKWMEEKDIRSSLFDINFEKDVAEVFKWYIVLLFSREAANQVGMRGIASAFSKILLLIPQWAVGLGILAIFLIIADKTREKIKSTGIIFSPIVGDLSYGTILFFGLVLSLPKFGFKNIDILVDSFKILVGGLAAGIALAIGIGFGSAIKEGPAKELIEREK